MTGADTWIMSTRREGVVPTIVTFRSVPSNITDNAISEYILCFGTSIDGEKPKVTRDTWQRQKGQPRWENGDRSVTVKLEVSVPKLNIIKGEKIFSHHLGQV
jgi:hypothetical protein